MTKTKGLLFTASIVLAVVFTFFRDVQAASQKDFYGVWVIKKRVDMRDQFWEINKNAITITKLPNTTVPNINVNKHRIVKWEKDKNDANGYIIYTLSENNEKTTLLVNIDAYSDLRIFISAFFSSNPFGIGGWETVKKSSAAELNKSVRDAEAAQKARIAAEAAKAAEAEVAKTKAIEAAKVAEAGRVARIAQLQDSFTDPRDSRKYKTIKIGAQTWMAENLNYDAKGSKCYDNCTKYGRLYNWKTAKKSCPSGWHLPSDDEWGILMQTVEPSCGKNDMVCSEAGKKLKAKSGWSYDKSRWNYDSLRDRNGNGTDEYGFSALPGGTGYSDGSFGSVGDSFKDVGERGNWWSATESSIADAYQRYMMVDDGSAYRINNPQVILFSVRCLKD